MDDSLLPSRSPQERPPSRRTILWNELEALHAQLQLPPPTATYTLEDLEAACARLRLQITKEAS
jgi:hypothetical protein